MVTETTTLNGVNPINNTNTKNKHWWITTQLAKLISYLSLTRIIGSIIPKRLSEWAKNVLGSNTPTGSKEDPSQYVKETDEFEMEAQKNKDLETKIEVKGKDLGDELEDGEFIDEEFSDMQELDTLELNALKKEVDELQAQASNQNNLQSEIDGLKAKLTKMKALLTQIRETSQKLREEREKLEQGVKTLKEELAKKEEEITQLKKQIEEKDAKISELTTANKELDDAKQAMEDKNSEQQKIISNQDKRIKELEEELKQKDGMIKSLAENKDVNEVIQEESERSKEQVKKLESKVNRLEENIRGKDAEIGQIRQENQQKLGQVKRENAEEVADLNNKITELQLQLKDLTSQLEGMAEQDNQLQEAQEQNNRITLEHGKLKSDLESEKSRTQGLQGEKAQHEKHLTALASQLETSEGERKKLEGKIDGLNVQLSTLQKTVQELKENKQSTQTQLSEMTSEKGVELAKSKEAAKKFETALSGQKKGWEVDSRQKIQEIERLTQSLEKLRRDLEETKKALAAQEKLAKQLQSEQEKIKGLERKVTKLTDQLKTGKDTVEELQGTMDGLNGQLKVKQENIYQLQQDTKELQQVKSDLEAANEKIEELQEKNQTPPQKAKASEEDAVSMTSVVSTAESSTHPLIQHIFHAKCKSQNGGVFNFVKSSKNGIYGTEFYQTLSRLNKELKKTFPELQGQHFCHRVFKRTIMSLLDKNGGKFESKMLLELLKSNFNDIAKEIMKPKIKEVITKHNNTLAGCINTGGLDQGKLLPAVKNCMEELRYNIQFADTLTSYVVNDFQEQKDDNSNLNVLLEQIVTNVLADARAKKVCNIVKDQKIVPKIESEFLSLNKDVCSVNDKGTEYQFNQKLINEINGTPSPSVSRIHSTASFTSLQSQRT